MGILTDDITRLCNGIVALRESRGALMDAIAHTAKDRRQAVSQMRAVFRDALSRAAKEGKAGRVPFASEIRTAVAGIKETVSDLLSGVSTDIEGARKAWLGLGPFEHKAEGGHMQAEPQQTGEKFEAHSAKARKTKKAKK